VGLKDFSRSNLFLAISVQSVIFASFQQGKEDGKNSPLLHNFITHRDIPGGIYPQSVTQNHVLNSFQDQFRVSSLITQ
jgi:hypothetical protein